MGKNPSFPVSQLCSSGILTEPLEQACISALDRGVGQVALPSGTSVCGKTQTQKRNVDTEVMCEQGGHSDKGSEIRTGVWGESRLCPTSSSRLVSLILLVVQQGL